MFLTYLVGYIAGLVIGLIIIGALEWLIRKWEN